jgi:hypothetical protein
MQQKLFHQGVQKSDKTTIISNKKNLCGKVDRAVTKIYPGCQNQDLNPVKSSLVLHQKKFKCVEVL